MKKTSLCSPKNVLIGLAGLLASLADTRSQSDGAERPISPSRAAPFVEYKTRYDVYGPMMDEFGLNDERRRRLRYLLEVPNLVLDGVRRQISLGVYKSREEADAGLRFTLDDAAQEIESMLTPEQFARLKPMMDQAPARSYMLGASSVLKVAGRELNDDEYVRMVNLVAHEFAKEKIHPAIHWVAVFAERKEVEVYLEKRKQVVRAVVAQAATFITDAQIASLMKHEQVQLDSAFDIWEAFRFKVPAARLRTAP